MKHNTTTFKWNTHELRAAKKSSAALLLPLRFARLELVMAARHSLDDFKAPLGAFLQGLALG